MTSRHSQFAIAVLMFSAAILAYPQSSRAADVCATAPVMITLHLTSDGSCRQESGGNTVSAPIAVGPKQCVQYAGAVIDPVPPATQKTPATFDVTFGDGPSPFYEFATTNTMDTVTTGPVSGTRGDTYNYRSVQIGSQFCTNGKQLGLIMK